MGRTKGGKNQLAPKIVEPGQVYDPKAEQDYNAHLITYNMGVMSLREVAKAHQNDPDVLADCSRDYLKLCYQCGMRPTNEAWYTSLGISKQTASQWRNGVWHKNDPRYRELIEYIDSYCSMNRAQLMMENRINPAVGIWYQKNLDGMRDNPMEEPNIYNEDEKTPDEIREQYKYLVEDPE